MNTLDNDRPELPATGLNPAEQASENERISREAEARANEAAQNNPEEPLLPKVQNSIKSKLEAKFGKADPNAPAPEPEPGE